MLKEIQHRVKNNLQLITALVRLEMRNERKGDKVNLPGLAGRIEALQLLYEAMSADALGNEIDLGHYLSQIATAIMNAHAVDGIRLAIKVEHTPISINVAMPVGLLVNEFMTNAFKHAFHGRTSGAITLECLRTSLDRYCVSVADDGVGMAEGVVWPIPGKISALLVQTLAENAQAEFKMHSAPGSGTRATMHLAHRPPKRKIN
jgi:two-component sensor histidine kinase